MAGPRLYPTLDGDVDAIDRRIKYLERTFQTALAQIAPGSITGDMIAQGTINGSNIAANTITAALISANAISADKIAAGSITAEKILAGAITTIKLDAFAVTAEKIAANAINADKLEANSVIASKILAGTIDAYHIKADAVTSDKIYAGSVTADKIAAKAVTSDKINVGSLDALSGNLGNITAGTITGATVQTKTTGSRVVMDSLGIHAYALDGTSKVFDIDAGTGIASFVGIAQIAASSVVPAGTLTGVLEPKVIPEIGGGNVLRYSNFEADIALIGNSWQGYDTSAGGVALTQTNDGRFGSKAVRVTAAGPGGYIYIYGSGGLSTYTVKPGDKWTVSGYFKSSYSTLIYVGLRLYKSNGEIIRDDYGDNIGGNITGGDDWKRFSKTVTIPADCALASFIHYSYNVNTGNWIELDGAQLEKGSVLTAYAPKPDEILPGTITGPELQAGSVTTEKMTANTINGNVIAANTLTASKITASTITTLQLAAGAVEATNIKAGAVTAEKISVQFGGSNLLQNSDFAWNSLDAPKRNGNASDNWLAFFSSPTIVADKTVPGRGYSFRGVGQNGSPYLVTPIAECNGQRVFMFSYWYRMGTGQTPRQIAIGAFTTDAAGGTVGQVFPDLIVSAPNSSENWQRAVVRFTLPAGTLGIRPYAQFLGVGATAETFYLGAFQVEAGELATSWRPQNGEIIPGTVGPTQITPDSITSAQIAANSILVGDINITGLLTAYDGSFTKLTSGQIEGVTITGSTFRTSATAGHVEFNNLGFYTDERSTVDRMWLSQNGLRTYKGSTLRGLYAPDGSITFYGAVVSTSLFDPSYLDFNKIQWRDPATGQVSNELAAGLVSYTDPNTGVSYGKSSYTSLKSTIASGGNIARAELSANDASLVAYRDTSGLMSVSAKLGNYDRTILSHNGNGKFYSFFSQRESFGSVENGFAGALPQTHNWTAPGTASNSMRVLIEMHASGYTSGSNGVYAFRMLFNGGYATRSLMYLQQFLHFTWPVMYVSYNIQPGQSFSISLTQEGGITTDYDYASYRIIYLDGY